MIINISIKSLCTNDLAYINMVAPEIIFTESVWNHWNRSRVKRLLTGQQCHKPLGKRNKLFTFNLHANLERTTAGQMRRLTCRHSLSSVLRKRNVRWWYDCRAWRGRFRVRYQQSVVAYDFAPPYEYQRSWSNRRTRQSSYIRTVIRRVRLISVSQSSRVVMWPSDTI